MYPKPLIRDTREWQFRLRLDARRVRCCIAGNFDGRIETQHVTALARFHTAKPGMTAAPLRAASFAKVRLAQAELAEKRHESAVVRRRVLIHQDAHRLFVLQRLQDGAGEIAFRKQGIAGQGAALLHQLVDHRIVERADHYVHGLGEERVGEGAELPVAEMRGGEQNAFAPRFGPFVMFEAFVAIHSLHVGGVDVGKTREGDAALGRWKRYTPSIVRPRQAASRSG